MTDHVPDSIWHWNRTGWRCPVCGKGNSPDALGCQHCQTSLESAGEEKLTLGRWLSLRREIAWAGLQYHAARVAIEIPGLPRRLRQRIAAVGLRACEHQADARNSLSDAREDR